MYSLSSKFYILEGALATRWYLCIVCFSFNIVLTNTVAGRTHGYIRQQTSLLVSEATKSVGVIPECPLDMWGSGKTYKVSVTT